MPYLRTSLLLYHTYPNNSHIRAIFFSRNLHFETGLQNNRIKSMLKVLISLEER
jgi:hypothetical protein